MIGHYIAHAVLRGSIYRAINHLPVVLVVLAFAAALWWLHRERSW